MKNFQGIILYFTILLIANTSLLQAQGEYSIGDLDISTDVEVPSNADGNYNDYRQPNYPRKHY